MGLDAYRDDDDSSDEEQNEEHNEEESEDEGSENEEQKSGLDAYKSKSKTEEIEEEKEREVSNPWINDFSANKWNSMDTEEKVRYVRENYDASYRPEVTLDDRWSWKPVPEVNCVCGENFTFKDSGMCLSCGRQYKMCDGNVIMNSDIDDITSGDKDD